MYDAGVGSFYGFLDDASQFARCVGTLDGGDAVGEINAVQKWTHKDAEQRERDPMTHQVEHDQAAAGFGDVADKIDDVGFGKMVYQTDSQRYIGFGQRIDCGVAGEDRDVQRRWRWAQIESDDSDAEFPMDLGEQCALAASDV